MSRLPPPDSGDEKYCNVSLAHASLTYEGRDRIMAELGAGFHRLCVLREELLKTR